jgi:hypothetical protein
VAHEVFQAKALESGGEVCFPRDENLLEGFFQVMSPVNVSLGSRKVDVMSLGQSGVLFLVICLYVEREA